MKLNLGSGYTCIPGFTNVDVDPRCKPGILADIRNLSGISDDTVDEILTAHTLEHILHKELFLVMRGINRIMKPGGTITIIVPDAQTLAHHWTTGQIPAHYFERTLLGPTPSATEHMAHKQLFWEEKLERYLYITGFTNILSQHDTHKYELITHAEKPK